MNLNNSKFSTRLREAMTARSLTQSDIVRLTGINKGALSSYLSGNYLPKQQNLYKLAKVLHVSEGWLMGFLDVSDEVLYYDEDANPVYQEALKSVSHPQTIAAHFDGDEYTEDELEEIKKFAEFVKQRRNKQ